MKVFKIEYLNLFLIITTLGRQSNGYNYRGERIVKVVDGTRLKEIFPIIYESSWPLFFEMRIPDYILNATASYESCMKNFSLDQSIGPYCDVILIYSEFMEKIEMLEAHSQIDPAEDPNTTLRRSKRYKRQILIAAALVAGAVGVVFGPAIKKTFKNFFGDNEEIKQFVNKLRDSVGDNHKDILQIHDYVMNLTQSLNNRFSAMEKGISKTFHLMLKQIHINREYLKALRFEYTWEHSISECRSGNIPSNFVTPKMLKKHVAEVNRVLSRDGYTVALPQNSLSYLYKIPIAECMMTKRGVFVKINLPIVSIASTWRLYEIIHIQFAYKGQTCQLYPTETSYLAQNQQQVVLINNHLLQHCSTKDHGLCHVPRNDKESRESIHCAVGILQGSSIEELRRSCSYQCFSNSDLRVHQLDVEENTLIITNADNVTLTCDGQSKVHNFERVGAVQLDLQCGCEVRINGELQKQPFPCARTTKEKSSVISIVPRVMTKLTGSLFYHGDSYFSNISAILDDDWCSQIAVNNITALKPLPEDEMKLSNFSLPEALPDDGDDGAWISTRVWLYVLTATFVFLLFDRIYSKCSSATSIPIPFMVAANAKGVGALHPYAEEAVDVFSLLGIAALIILAIFVLRALRHLRTRQAVPTGAIAVPQGSLDLGTGIAATAPPECDLISENGMELKGIEVGRAYNDYFVASNTYICRKYGEDYYPILITPLEPGSRVKLDMK